MDAMSSAVWVLKMHAMRLLGGIIIEIEHRDSITDERYAKEWDKTHKHVRWRLDDGRPRPARAATSQRTIMAYST
jgi:hypothetical protein